jgi:hypothetical protein
MISKKNLVLEKFSFLAALTMKITALWDVKPFDLAVVYNVSEEHPST